MEELLAPLLCGIDYAHGGGKTMPLTTPDLQLLSERMQVRAEEMKDRVFATVKSRYSKITELARRASTAALDVETVDSQLRALLDDSSLRIGDTSFDSKLWKLSAEVKGIRSELRVKTSALAVVKSTVEVRDRLLAGKELFDGGQILSGARKIAEVKGIVDDDDEDTLLMHELLKQLLSGIYSEVDFLLAGLCSKVVSVNFTEGILAVNFVTVAGSRHNFVAILETMEVLGLLDGFLGRFTDNLCKLLALLVHSATVVRVEQDSDRAVLRITRDENARVNQSSIEGVYKEVLDFVKFINEHLLHRQKVWMLKLGRSIWPRLADMIIQNHLRKAIPADHTQFQHFEQIQILTSEFEEALEAENFVSVDDEGGLLSNFTADVEIHFSANKRKDLLAKARDIIMRFDYRLLLDMAAEREEKDRLIFREDKYVVSYLPKQLLPIVQDTLKDACSSTPRLALELYKVARDIVLLYRAIVPSQVLVSDKSSVKAAPVFYNDCLYIANELTTYSQQYSSSLPVDLQQSCTLMDLVSVFQSMGYNMLSTHVKLINNQLLQALDSANGFKSTDERRGRERAQSALQQVVSIFRSTHNVWQEFLPSSFQVKQLTMLADSLVSRIVFEVLSIKDMAAEETVQLHNLLDELILDLGSVLASVEKHSRKSLDILVPSWRKLKRLSELLEMSLRPITKAWESGILPSAGFSPAEVQSLIKAIFTDTSLRAECLERIV
ncbi:hypothetical protein SELMODRAFT_419689 [Selaginella moellendorffii]|uniref:Centromere/kinetochore protein zw10 homolog n=1 Tax=Selaginella moellendorffii TaxID=88036 RepID=D8S9Q8_SELML|nr:centromere/kinetochore protein zw10 homolog [Selaginella moellendorffii]EFJ19003.1 hypothetical protein SELMODRAFT_419689 [Selaginella moellendorffii]|eukprot:XP_002980133.1 centromere/kinetochore protein zw10 homolog [Selaginella moellendorffii]